MHLSLHFLIFLQILGDVNETQSYKFIITKELFKPQSRSQANSISCIIPYFPFSLPLSSIWVWKYWDLQESYILIHILFVFSIFVKIVVVWLHLFNFCVLLNSLGSGILGNRSAKASIKMNQKHADNGFELWFQYCWWTDTALAIAFTFLPSGSVIRHFCDVGIGTGRN